MVLYFCGYFVAYSTLKRIMPPGETVPFMSGFRPYVRHMKVLLESPTNTLNASFDEMFSDARPISLPRKSQDEDDDVGVILVRVQGDPDERPEMFRETNGDKRVKKILEECLGVEVGPFMYMYYGM